MPLAECVCMFLCVCAWVGLCIYVYSVREDVRVFVCVCESGGEK